MHPVLRAETASCDAELLQRVRERHRQIHVVLGIVVHRAVKEIGHAERQAAGDRNAHAAGMLRVVAMPVCTAAPARTIRSVTWRPWSGSSTIRSFSTTSLIPALRTSTIGAAASTDDRLLEVADGQRCVDRRCRADLQNDTGLHVRAESLQRTSNRYGPVGMFGITHAPSPSVATVRMNPVSVCVAVTVTPGARRRFHR